MKSAIAFLSLSMLVALPQQAAAWGDDGHKTIALIAEHYLTPTAKNQVDDMLAGDIDPLTQHPPTCGGLDVKRDGELICFAKPIPPPHI